LHFSPTEKAKNNLLAEGVEEKNIFVTGNTIIDALFEVRRRVSRDALLQQSLQARFPWLTGERRMVLVTGHRRENFGRGFKEICRALVDLAGQYPEDLFVYPVHLNPNVLEPVDSILRTAGVENMYLIEPLEYSSFIWFLDRCYLVLTDSGGVQEEAPSLGKPVVVMRKITERPEAVEAGTVCLAGNSREKIVSSVSRLLDDSTWYQTMSRAMNPYGDGLAAGRIARAVASYLRRKPDVRDAGEGR
ncbi:MAG: UDP-N-acetylglucosamine 2-epimerase (non-hydrolyzing), partial [Desulfobulbaceae bacterium]|nr:UDP-N-acetylglucosamine 2-epimerase (non-hydrolyzing) [Desulfobulbaceae bacterium]